LVFSVLIDHLGGRVLFASSGLSILALAALCRVQAKVLEAAAVSG
jgi:hypothetical protein